MSEETKNLVASSVDYLTVTTNTNKATGQLMSALFDQLTPAYIAAAKKKRWKFMSYDGYALEGVRYGIRGNEGIVMLSGYEASVLWPKIAPSRTKCTRIDLAVTITLEIPQKDVAATAYQSAILEGNKNGAIVMNSRGGQTCYVGSRSSDQYGRLYDKGAEQGNPPGHTWRYEVETKKPRSEAVVAQLLDVNEPRSWINSYVYTWFLARGLTPLFQATYKMNAIEISSRVSSVDRQLKWLSSSVRPTVQRLLDAGKEEQVYNALGLPLM